MFSGCHTHPLWVTGKMVLQAYLLPANNRLSNILTKVSFIIYIVCQLTSNLYVNRTKIYKLLWFHFYKCSFIASERLLFNFLYILFQWMLTSRLALVGQRLWAMGRHWSCVTMFEIFNTMESTHLLVYVLSGQVLYARSTSQQPHIWPGLYWRRLVNLWKLSVLVLEGE